MKIFTFRGFHSCVHTAAAIAFVGALAAVCTANICINTCAAEVETDENGNVIANLIEILPNSNTRSYVIVSTNNGRYENTTVTRQELRELNASESASESTDSTLVYALNSPEGGSRIMTGSLVVYDEPVTGGSMSSGTWEHTVDDDTDLEAPWRFVGTDDTTIAVSGWYYIGDNYSYLEREGHWYYFDESGYLTGGHITSGDNTYYASEKHDGTFGQLLGKVSTNQD